jgi:phage baseplate assembly protein W
VSRNTPLKNLSFRDLDLNFDVHPNSKDLITLKGDDAVSRSLRNLIQYDHYEKPFNPDFGSNIRRSLFENFGPQTATTLKNEITQVIQNYEPRVDVQSVNVSADTDENRYRVVIKYLVVNQATTRTAQLFLERLR